MARRRKRSRRRFLKPGIQNRLLLSFLIVAILPMSVALYMVVKLNESMLEREKQNRLEQASIETGRLIAQAEDEAVQIASELIQTSSFDELYMGNVPKVFTPPAQIDNQPLVGIWAPPGTVIDTLAMDPNQIAETGTRALMVAQVNNQPTLIAGAVFPVIRDKKRVGHLAVGRALDRGFTQDVEIQTGVVARIFYQRAKERTLRFLFPSDDLAVSELMDQQVRRVTAFLVDHPNVSVILEGHTDDTGSVAHNYHLSARRAGVIADALVRNGISRRRISTRNYGEARPIAPNTTREGRAMNRRVEARFIAEPGSSVGLDDLPIDEEMHEAVFAQHQEMYDSEAVLNGMPYRALYRPLLGTNERVVGMLFLGLPDKYTFGATVSTWRFWPAWIALGAVLALVLGYLVSRSISQPLREFVTNVHQVASGNIDLRLQVHSRDELGDLAAAFNDMTHELRTLRAREAEFRRRDRLAAMGEMAAGIAHEIRNPLNVMRNAAQRVLRTVRAEQNEPREMSNFIIEEVDRLNRVVSEFMDFARHPLPELKATDVNALIGSVLTALASEAEEASVDVQFTPDPILRRALLDPEQGRRVLINLFQNAFQQMRKQGGGTLYVDTRNLIPVEDSRTNPDGFVQIEVRDTGAGIPAEVMDRVFDPFFTTREEGVGLGLSLVHNIITAHNGEISVTSTEGQGATFVVTLPIASATFVEEHDADTSPAEERPISAVTGVR